LATGIAIYGDNNVVRNNKVTNNGQVNNPAAAAINSGTVARRPFIKVQVIISQARLLELLLLEGLAAMVKTTRSKII
jgi:hypothetical protein